MNQLEMWGGIECTYNRVGDRYINQCDKNGHSTRLSDLQLFTELGIKKIRYPCLWELVAPKSLDECNWQYLDERLTELKRLNLDFVAGFLHHGSGPRYTSLIDPDFPEKLASYARLFINRYPWVNDFTPINEINTTARFSCLYGHWYPHLTSDLYYLKAMVLQCKGTILAMKEIKRVNPKARLIQTDDVGKCQSTEPLTYQRDFENERRWLSYDLLCGKVDETHSLYKYMIECGITAAEMDWFKENAYSPDVIGINHYLISNRFLDHNLELYPEEHHGGNGRDQYADVGAVDTGQAEPVAPEEIFMEAWNRFHIPLAVTECHTRGHREAQMRWLNKIWKTAEELRTQGVEFESVTTWSLLGTYDWHKLCTQCEFFYEPGVFDLRHPDKIPVPTGLSKLVHELANKGSSNLPILGSAPAWDTPRRMLWGAKDGDYTVLDHPEGVRPVFIIGATGTLGQALARVCGARHIHYRLLSRQEMDISNIAEIEMIVEAHKPWAVINAAGYVRVDDAEKEPDLCFKNNVDGAVNLAKICSERKIELINFSSDLVFDGNSDDSYNESHSVSPMNIYGKSKVECEKQVLHIYPESLIIRTSAFFGPWDEYNFVTKTLRDILQNQEVRVPNDMFVSPTYLPDLANECLNFLIDGIVGIVHLTNEGKVSWHEFASLALEKAKESMKINSELLIGKSLEEFSFEAKRPQQSVLTSEIHNHLPTLDDALTRYMLELQVPIENYKEMNS